MLTLVESRRIHANGRHNAFVGFAHWGGAYHLAFRESRGHMGPEASQIILSSADAHAWREVFRHERPTDAAGTRYDYRDSYLLPEPERLLLYSCVNPKRANGKRDCSYTQVQTLEPGGRWGEPRLIAEGCRILWKPIRLGSQILGAAYQCADGQTRQVMLMASDDGVTGWRDVARIGPGSETVLCPWTADELLAIVRTEEPPYFLQFHLAKPPYTTWRQVGEYAKIVQGQHAIHWRKAWWLVARERPDYMATADPDRPSHATHRVKLWRIDGPGALTEALELPSAGDCGYAGAVVEPDDSVRIAYYSQHETGRAGEWSATEPADLYLAKVAM